MINNKIWEKMELNSPTGDIVTARLAIPELSKKLYIGVDANKQRHIFISLNKRDKEYKDLGSKGLSVVTRDLVVLGSKAKRYIDIICHDKFGHVIFDVIGNEIAEKLDKGEPKEVISSVIGKWRRFWGQPPSKLLTREEIIGLFAEVWFLYYWLLPKTKKADAVKRWRGPFSSRHDFEWKGKSVEVKATTNQQSRIHKIHGIDQLLPPENGELFLFSLRVREEEGAKNTLPGLIALCQKALKDDVDTLSIFENILAIVGYSPIHGDEYSKLKLRVVNEKLYRVTDNFPRLTINFFKEGLPLGVGLVEYSINLDGFDNLCIAKSPKGNIEL